MFINSSLLCCVFVDVPLVRHTCALQEFWCNETKLCIPRSQLCDFTHDCLYGEDESNPICGKACSINHFPVNEMFPLHKQLLRSFYLDNYKGHITLLTNERKIFKSFN